MSCYLNDCYCKWLLMLYKGKNCKRVSDLTDFMNPQLILATNYVWFPVCSGKISHVLRLCCSTKCNISVFMALYQVFHLVSGLNESDILEL